MIYVIYHDFKRAQTLTAKQVYATKEATLIRLSWIFLLTILTSLSLASGSGPGDDGDGAASRKSSQSDGEFYAWLVHPEHVFEANLMQLRVRLFPNTNEFPGMRKADVNRFDDTVVQAMVALEDLSVPLWNTQIANRPQSHIQREKARGREALEFCRRAILNASGLLVVAPRYEDTDRFVHCRLELLDEQGDKVDLGALLVKNGFGSRDVLDWGRRVPQ